MISGEDRAQEHEGARQRQEERPSLPELTGEVEPPDRPEDADARPATSASTAMTVSPAGRGVDAVRSRSRGQDPLTDQTLG